MIEQVYLKPLRIICGRLSDLPCAWAVTGSLGLAIQGIPVEVHDIDLQTSQAGAYLIEGLFSECVIQPVHHKASPRIRSHFGVLEIEGVRVEIMGGLQKLLADAKWEEPVDVERYLRWVHFEGLRIPVLPLEYERSAYLKLGRLEKAELIGEWLENQT
jgi:hypothetical protein